MSGTTERTDHGPAITSPLEQPFLLGPHFVTPSRNRIGRGENARTIQPKIMRLLCVLAAEPGRTFSRGELTEVVWDGIIVSDAAIDRAVCNLRKALDDRARRPVYVETIRKRGVRLMVEVETARPAPPRRVRLQRRPLPGRLADKSGFGMSAAALCTALAAVASMPSSTPTEVEPTLIAEAAPSVPAIVLEAEAEQEEPAALRAVPAGARSSCTEDWPVWPGVRDRDHPIDA